MEKYDKTIYGVIAGLVLPVIGFFLSFLIKTRGTLITFDDYWQMTMRGDHQQDILIFCLIPIEPGLMAKNHIQYPVN